MNKSNFFNFCWLAFFVCAAAVLVVLFLIWGISLPNTALLWINGPVAGWIQLLVLTFVFGFGSSLPAFIVWDEIVNNK